jgi:hypothetical protein
VDRGAGTAPCLIAEANFEFPYVARPLEVPADARAETKDGGLPRQARRGTRTRQHRIGLILAAEFDTLRGYSYHLGMMKITAITCLLLITVGSAAAWAAICCTQGHEATMEAVEDCLVPALRVVPAAGTAKTSDGGLRQLPTFTAARARPLPEATPGTFLAGDLPPGTASPAVSQTTPVLLR